jgi:ATP-binding cassette subfamily C (CFTR/MRP) protein 4
MGFLASFAGISSLLLLIPAQAVLAKYIAKLRNATAKMTDERVRLTGEAITGVLGFKMLAWEDPLYEQILKIRAEEKRYIRKMNVIRALNMALTFIITPFVSLITFTVARYTSAEFTVGNIFYSIALLALPKLYMCEFFVHGVEATSEAKISVQRIAEFLSLSEPAPLEKFAMSGEDGSNDDVVLRIKKSSFGYHRFDSSGIDAKKGVDVVLKDFSMAIQSGQLVAIVGPIGSGKTSILNVCLGELEVCGGLDMHEVLSMKAKHVAFCPQAPWIISGTIRENILFGKEMDEELYIKVIRSCCLDVDLANMAAGDETEIGERGISLSGGQKARVSLARAAYSDADLLLLDDPLSAVDAKVSGMMFQECIGPSGLLKSRTRILVTHQKHVLPMCDWIIVLCDGSISDQGTHAELARRQVPEVIMPMIGTYFSA